MSSRGEAHGVSFTGSVPTGKLYKAAENLTSSIRIRENGAILNDSEDLEKP